MDMGEIEGLDKLDAAFRELASKAQRGVVRGALRKAAQPVLREARNRVKVRKGLTKRALAISATVNASGAEAAVGAKRRAQGGRASLIHIIERQDPFLMPAYEAAKDEAVQVFADAMRGEIEKATLKARLV